MRQGVVWCGAVRRYGVRRMGKGDIIVSCGSLSPSYLPGSQGGRRAAPASESRRGPLFPLTHLDNQDKSAPDSIKDSPPPAPSLPFSLAISSPLSLPSFFFSLPSFHKPTHFTRCHPSTVCGRVRGHPWVTRHLQDGGSFRKARKYKLTFLSRKDVPYHSSR